MNDKPMVIHKKKNIKLHVKTTAKIKQKRGSICLSKKTPKVVSAKKHSNRTKEKPVVKKKISSSREKNHFSESEAIKEDIRKTKKKEKVTSKAVQSDGQKKSKDKDTVKKKEVLSIVSSVGTAVALDQMDGGNEVYESYITAKAIAAPIESASEAGKNLFQSQIRKKKENPIEKKFSQKGKSRKSIKNHTDKKNKSTVNSAVGRNTKQEKKADRTQKEKAKEKKQKREAIEKRDKSDFKRFKTVTKEKKRKTSAYRDMQMVNRNRKIQFFLDKLNAEEKQKDSVSKLAKDLFFNKVMFVANKAAPMIGLVLMGLMFLVALAAVPVMAVVTVIYNSPFAIFFPSISSENSTQQVLSSYMSEFYEEINEEMEKHSGYDVSQKFYVDYEGGDIPDNYYDVLAVYMVVHGNGDTATDMTEEAEENLKDIFEDMCSYYITDRTDIEWDEEGEMDSYTTVKEVNVKLKWYFDMILEYGLNAEEQEMLAELMKPEYLAVLRQTVDGDRGESISPEQYQAVLDAVSDENGKQVVSFVLSKVGYPYSQAYRDSGSYYDCSSLAYYAWQSAGVNLMYEGANTVAAEGKFCYDNNYLVSYDEMQAGDLIFYSYEKNGRFFDITHVAVYVGDGKVVEAANTRIGVVYRPVQSKNSIVFIGRPR